MILSPYNWLSKFYKFYIATLVSIISRPGLTIEAHCRNQHIKIKKSELDHEFILTVTYIRNSMERFSYKAGYGICGYMCIETFKRRASLGIDKRLQDISNIP